MSRLSWNSAGERRFSAGVDRGVLYVGSHPGVPWNGLLAVSETPNGGEIISTFFDGIKISHRASRSEFKAKIEAFTYPDEFAECDGTASLGNGLFATQQRKSSFGLSYRVGLGNDQKGTDYGYRVHLVYNALAKVSEVTHATISDTITPESFGWDISTKPPLISGVAPTSHFVIESNDTPDPLLNDIEDILYGTDVQDPRLPSIEELMYMFTSYSVSSFDGGFVGDTYFALVDAGDISEPQTSIIDGGSP